MVVELDPPLELDQGPAVELDPAPVVELDQDQDPVTELDQDQGVDLDQDQVMELDPLWAGRPLHRKDQLSSSGPVRFRAEPMKERSKPLRLMAVAADYAISA